MKTPMKVVSVAVCSAATVLALAGSALAGAAGGPEARTGTIKPMGVNGPTTVQADELKYVPIRPCRIVDTRASAEPLGNLSARTYYAAGTFGFAPQGGTSGGCGVPAAAKSVSVVATAVNPVHSGYLRTYPTGTAEPAATVLNYAASSIGVGVNAGLGSDGRFVVKNYNGPTDLVIDVSGYYVTPISGLIGGSPGDIFSGSPRLKAISRSGVGDYLVTIDRDVRNCSAVATPYSETNYKAITNTYEGASNQLSVSIYDGAGNPVDYWAYLQVDC